MAKKVSEELFVKELRDSVVTQGLEDCRGMYQEAAAAASQDLDPSWQAPAQLFNKLSEEDRDALFQAVRLAVVDTVSHVLGVLDGSCVLESFEEDFTLSYDGENLERELQDLFLEMEED